MGFTEAAANSAGNPARRCARRLCTGYESRLARRVWPPAQRRSRLLPEEVWSHSWSSRALRGLGDGARHWPRLRLFCLRANCCHCQTLRPRPRGRRAKLEATSMTLSASAGERLPGSAPTPPACEVCGRPDALQVGDRWLCPDCLAVAGSCCPEFGAWDAWSAGAEAGSRVPPECVRAVGGTERLPDGVFPAKPGSSAT